SAKNSAAPVSASNGFPAGGAERILRWVVKLSRSLRISGRSRRISAVPELAGFQWHSCGKWHDRLPLDYGYSAPYHRSEAWRNNPGSLHERGAMRHKAAGPLRARLDRDSDHWRRQPFPLEKDSEQGISRRNTSKIELVLTNRVEFTPERDKE